MTTPTQSPPLKACPFCGGQKISKMKITINILVSCENEKCPIYDRRIPLSEWNTRADAPHIFEGELLDKMSSCTERIELRKQGDDVWNDGYDHGVINMCDWLLDKTKAAIIPTPPITGDRQFAALDNAPHIWVTIQSNGQPKIGTIEHGENEKYFRESTVISLLGGKDGG